MRAVFFDLDNTLYDWVKYFSRAFRAMADTLSGATGLPIEMIEREARAIFHAHGTVEYGFWLQELPSIRLRHPGLSGHEIAREYWPAVTAFKEQRRRYLAPYDGVLAGLHDLQSSGLRTVALTDATHWHAEHRLAALGLTEYFDWIVARPDVPVPAHTDLTKVSTATFRPDGPKRFAGLPRGLRKPNPEVIHSACRLMDLSEKEVLVVGDNLLKDITMAQVAGAGDVWAAYGATVEPKDLETLVRISDWPPEAIAWARDPMLLADRVGPTFTAWSFEEVVAYAMT